MTRDELIAAMRAAAAKRGTPRLTRAAFTQATKIGTRAIGAHFATWREACAAAGLAAPTHPARLCDETLFAAMREAFVACGGIVPRRRFQRSFLYGASVLDRRFGTAWEEILAAFAGWLEASATEFPYRAELAAEIARRREGCAAAGAADLHRRETRPRPRDFGDPVGFRGLFHAPTNEIGVVLAFGAAADALGFGVETVGAAFPDCTAKRRVAAGRWRSVRIEFEYKSRNFRDHRHDPAGCDLIVCWEHDWPEAPVEVLELRTAIQGLRRS
jgi:hypothetical protein